MSAFRFLSWYLIFGPQPADVAFGLLGGTGGIEGDNALQDLFIGERPGPAVGISHGRIELPVQV